MKYLVGINLVVAVAISASMYINPYVSDKRVKQLQKELVEQQGGYESIIGSYTAHANTDDKNIEILEHELSVCLIKNKALSQ